MGKPKSPCTAKCTERRIEPNCHHPERCTRWAEYIKQNAEWNAAHRRHPADSVRYNDVKQVKIRYHKEFKDK